MPNMGSSMIASIMPGMAKAIGGSVEVGLFGSTLARKRLRD